MWRPLALTALSLSVAMSAVAAGDGAALFTQNCALCHQSGGSGVPGQFPRLTGRIAKIATPAVGRTYLIDLLTFGMSGQITVDNQPLFGLMPPFAQIPAADVAALLNYVMGLGAHAGKAPPAFSSAEVTARRQVTSAAPVDVHAARQALDPGLFE
jgi:mono/diheme cytochrome c family protein